MVVLYIFLGVLLFSALIAAILNLYLKIIYKYDGSDFSLYLRIGPFKYTVFPEKTKKTNYKKLARKLRGKKLSKLRFVSSKDKDSAKKEFDIKEFFSDLRLDKMIETISQCSKNPEFTKILLNAVKAFAYKFKHSLFSQVERIVIHVDEKDASETCIRCGVVSQALSYLLEFLNVFTVLQLPPEGNIAVVPSFDNGGYKFDIKGKFKIKIIHILIAVIKAAFMSVTSDIEKKFM